ncbi:MAG: hypothetical protein EOO09_01960 [Chitinophagaceae bacterium]|nr:MAG: hypothetical protein EOO09_01960 [Chitinophagaceae bacterium]
MNNFEDIQNSWLSQPVGEATPRVDLRAVQSKWQKRQDKLLKSNLRMTIGFAVSMGVIIWVYFAYESQYHFPFQLSIAIILLLQFIFLGVAWKSYAFRKESFEDSSVEFIDYQVSKLEWQRKTLTTYVWVYNVLLWMAICLYSLEITRNGSLLFRVSAIAGITVYIGGISLWIRHMKQKKQLKAIDEMLRELAAIRKSISTDQP